MKDRIYLAYVRRITRWWKGTDNELIATPPMKRPTYKHGKNLGRAYEVYASRRMHKFGSFSYNFEKLYKRLGGI